MQSDSDSIDPMILLLESEDDYVGHSQRTTGMLTEEQQESIHDTTIGLAGVAGHSDTVLTLAEMGFRRFRIAADDYFRLSQQSGSHVRSLSHARAEMLVDEIQNVTRDVEAELVSEEMPTHNARFFVEGLDILIDGLAFDLMHERRHLYDMAMLYRVPVFSSPLIGYGAGLAVFAPAKGIRFADFFGEVPQHGTDKWHRFLREYQLNFMGWKPMGIDLFGWDRQTREGKPPDLAAGCRVRAGLVSSAIAGWIFHPQMVPVVPTTVFVDLLGLEVTEMGALKRWLMKALMRRVLDNTKLGRIIHVILDFLSGRYT